MEQSIWEWVNAAGSYDAIPWERLPELDLYMDQVITLLSKQLEPFSIGEEKLLTPSMINNYVKDGVLPRPAQKKYSREHLAMLMMICMLKSVLTLPEINAAMKGNLQNHTVEELYPDFAEAQQKALREVADNLNSLPSHDENALYRRAVMLALEANARRIAASRILDSLAPKEAKEAKEPKKEKPKKDTPPAEE